MGIVPPVPPRTASCSKAPASARRAADTAGVALSADGALKAFSVQYHPEAAAGPHDAAYLFDRFVSLVEGTL